jgi:MFS family permease
MLKEALKGLVKNRRLRLVSIAETLGFGFGEATFHFQAVFFNLLIPQWLIGVVRSVNHLFGAIGFWTAGRVIKHFGYKRVLIGGNIITSLIRLLVLVFASVLSPFVMAILNVDYGYSSTAKNGLMQREFSDNQRSTMGSIVSLAGSLCFSIISVLLGFIADITTPLHAMLFGLSSNIAIIWIYTAVFTTENAEHKY